MDYFRYIERNPQICGGEPVIKGTRVTLRTILASLAEGASIEELITDLPTISADDVRAVIAFAAARSKNPIPPVFLVGIHVTSRPFAPVPLYRDAGFFEHVSRYIGLLLSPPLLRQSNAVLDSILNCHEQCYSAHQQQRHRPNQIEINPLLA